MPRLFVSLWSVVCVALVVGAAQAQSSTPGELPRGDVGSDLFESPEGFDDLWDRHGGDGPLDAPANRAAASDALPGPAVAPETTGSSGASADADADPSDAVAEPAEVPSVRPRTLAPEMQRLRDRVRYRLGEQMGRNYNVNANTATDVLYYCLGFGRRAGVRTNKRAEPVSGVGCLCFNYSFRGYRLLATDDDRPVARVGYGRQAYPSQLFAVLAQSRVALDYPVRADGLQAEVGDLVENEKLRCRETSDLSLKLVGLSYYVSSDETWVNSDGETWSLDRAVRAEMDRPFTQASGSGVHRLMGLSHAVQRRIKDELPVDGSFARAQRYLVKFQDHALKLQNANGSWHPKAFRFRGVSSDTAGTLRATGMILDWLVYSLPEDRLEDRRVVQSVEYLTRLLGSQRYAANTPQLPTHEIAGVMHAVRALRVYDERVFKPADPPAAGESVARGSEPSTDR